MAIKEIYSFFESEIYINYDEYIQLHENLINQNVIDKVYILFDSEKFDSEFFGKIPTIEDFKKFH